MQTPLPDIRAFKREAPRINWAHLIFDLEAAGHPASRIAAECMRSTGWVQSLKNRTISEPRFHDGVILSDLWVRLTGLPESQLPKVTASPGG